jgi:hypothetical protein
MWDFSNDEAIFFLSTLIVAIVVGVRYYRPLFSISPMNISRGQRRSLFWLPIIAILPTLIVVGRWADPQVVGHPDYMTLFAFGAAVWIFTASQFISVFGISMHDDALERQNRAALIASYGVVLGAAIVYALCNIGRGPTIWTTIVPAIVGTMLLIATLLLIELVGGSVSDSITIDRDIASALRLAGATIASAIVLGRAGAGDWASWNQTWIDFVTLGWPAAALALAAGAVHKLLRPTDLIPQPDIWKRGLFPAVLFLIAGVLFAIFL